MIVEAFQRIAVSAQLSVARLRDREEGQALVEYALILALIAVVSIAVLTAIGFGVRDKLQAIANAI